MKIAILKFYGHDNPYNEDCYSNFDIVIQSISDWVEVTKEEYEKLLSNKYKYNYIVAVQNPEYKEFGKKKVLSTVEDYLKDIKELEDAETKRREQERLKQLERKAAKQEKSLEQKRKQLEKLKKELGET